MRRWSIAVPMMLLCLLCACGGKETNPLQAPMDFRKDLLQQGGCRVELAGTADLEEGVYSFRLEGRLDSDGSTEFTLLEPEELAGITVKTDGKTGRLICDAVSVAFGTPSDERLAPVSVPAALIRAWTEGYISSAGAEEELLLAVYELGYDSDTVSVYTWFDETGAPVRAELALRGKTEVRLTLSKFELLS